MLRGFEGILRNAIVSARSVTCVAALGLLACLTVGGSAANAVDDSYRPPEDTYSGQSGVDTYSPPPGSGNTYQPAPGPRGGDANQPYNGPSRGPDSDPGGYGAPYAPP